MARPKRELVMARCAREALLAAVEICNKPTVEYREQTATFLLVNAWEVLIKARIVQENGGKIQAIYRRLRNSNRFRYSADGEVLTIEIRGAVNRSKLPEEVRSNILGLVKIRNRAAHLGVLVPELKQAILEFSAASVQNFVKTYGEWFGESIKAPYLLPLGFVGTAQSAVTGFPVRQRKLLEELSELAKGQDSGDSEYSVVLQVRVELNRGLSGGGNIGLTSDPSSPKVSISDDEALQTFPFTYRQVVDCCRQRYEGLKRNQQFHQIMKAVNEDPTCSYERKLDPTQDNGAKKRFYNIDATLAKLDGHYS